MGVRPTCKKTQVKHCHPALRWERNLVRKCIIQCVRAGSPLAILTKSGELYTLLSAQLPDRDERRRLFPYAGRYVRATGRLFERGGTHAISIEKIEIVSGW